VCEHCDKFAARQFWQPSPKTISEIETVEETSESLNGQTIKQTAMRKEAWNPPQVSRKVAVSGGNNGVVPAGCGGCGGRKNYTK
jgi:hypothetical protein